MKGKITEWNDEKGYGFIVSPQCKSRVFVHISQFNRGTMWPKVNTRVSFKAEKDKQGRINAKDVSLAGLKAIPFSVQLSGVFLLLVCIITGLNGTGWLWFSLYLGLSPLTYLVYKADKRSAIAGDWRVSENTLHFLAVTGGWPGALVAQHRLRHKSQKQPFKTLLWLTIVCNIAVYLWTITPYGPLWLEEAGHTIQVQLVNWMTKL
ncbi:DUF1294 domain-containing protein [Vibrio proteolyticus]|uniref:CSD domain-containing protein n=1 Tax=Vibrio proteolyticus NBRC 13287 TaxID=1219065 RepID=U2ZX48_VIBPR|nr:cold shock and DUF1294 domain-containing protein [Vibrio proteolyticus]GAD65677.1 hypothetical protein VPR01S_01_04510 [Vibrio proteolyticus NBRC 13287]